MKKVMGEVLSLLTGNGLCALPCEKSREKKFKCTIRATYAHTDKYMCYEYDTNEYMTSDENDTIVDTYNYNSEWIWIRIIITWKF